MTRLPSETPAPDDSAKPPTPETQPRSSGTWAALVESILDLFGKYRPFLIVCLLVIVIIGGIMWWTRDTTRHLSEVSQKQMDTTKAGLDLHAQMLEQTKNTHDALQKFSSDLIQARTALAEKDTEIERGRKALDNANTMHNRTEARLEFGLADAKGKLEKAEERVRDLGEDLHRARVELIALTARHERFSDHVRTLVTAVREQGSSDPEIAKLAGHVIDGVDAAVASETPEEALKAFATNPDEPGIELRLRRAVYSIPEEELRALVRQPLGYRAWYARHSELIGIVEVHGDEMRNVVMIRTDVKTSVLAYESARILQGLNPSNVDRRVYAWSVSRPEINNWTSLPGLHPRSGLLRLSDAAGWRFIGGQGGEPEMEPLSLLDSLAIEPELSVRLPPEKRRSALAFLWFAKRSTEFTRKDLADARLGLLPGEIERMVTDLLVALARREFDTAANRIAGGVSRDDLGRLGAAVIHPDFQVLPIRSGDSPVQAFQGRAPEEPPGALWIEARFGRGMEYRPEERVLLAVERDAPDAPWQLTGIRFLGNPATRD